MPLPTSRKEQVLAAIAANLALITTASGYNTTVALVERQRVQLRDETLPCLFVNDSNEEFEYYPARLVQSTLTYVVLGGIIAAAGIDSTTLGTELNAFIDDFKTAMYRDLFLQNQVPGILPAPLANHILMGIRTDEGFMAPKAVMVARCVAIFRYQDSQP